MVRRRKRKLQNAGSVIEGQNEADDDHHHKQMCNQEGFEKGSCVLVQIDGMPAKVWWPGRVAHVCTDHDEITIFIKSDEAEYDVRQHKIMPYNEELVQLSLDTLKKKGMKRSMFIMMEDINWVKDVMRKHEMEIITSEQKDSFQTSAKAQREMDSDETMAQVHRHLDSDEIIAQVHRQLKSDETIAQVHRQLDSDETIAQVHRQLDSEETIAQVHRQLDSEETIAQVHRQLDSEETIAQVHRQLDSEETIAQVHRQLDSEETIAQVHRQLDSDETIAQAYRQLDSDETSEQVHRQLDSDETTEQGHRQMGSDETTEQVHRQMGSDETTEQVDRQMGSDETTEQVNRQMGSDETTEQVHRQMGSDETTEQVHRQMGSDETTEQVDRQMGSDETTEQVNRQMGSDETTEQVHRQMGSDETTEQVHRQMGSDEITKQVRRQMGSDETTEQVHRQMGSDETTEQVHRQMGSDETTEQVHRQMGSDETTEQVNRQMGSDETTEQVHRQMGSDETTEQVHRQMGSDETTEQVHRQMGSDETTEQVRRQMGSDETTEQVRRQMGSDETTEQVHRQMGSEETTEQVDRQMGSDETTEQVHRQMGSDETTEQVHRQMGSDETTEQVHRQMGSEETIEQVDRHMNSEETFAQVHREMDSDETIEQVLKQIESYETTEHAHLQMDCEQSDSDFGGSYSDPDYVPSGDDDQLEMIQDSQDESDGYCSDEYPILNTKVSVCKDKISERNSNIYQETDLNKKGSNSISDIEQDIEVSEFIADDDSTSEDEDDILRDSGNPKIFIRKVSKSETTKTGKKKRNSRVFNSYQFCAVCNVKVSNFSQHIERHKDKHKNCPEIQQILCEKDEKERKLLLKHLRAKFNHEYNMRTLKAGKGEILLERRPTMIFKHDDFGPCPRCLLWIAKKLLQKHQNKCLSKNTEDCTLKKAAIQTRSDTIANRISTVASKILAKEVFETMKVDEVGTIARNDPLIVQLGNQWIQKNIGNTLKRGSYTSQIMRLVARLLLHLRKIKPLNEPTMWNYLKPMHLDDIIKATLMTASQSIDNEEDIEKPSNALKLGYDIKRLINGKIGLAIKSGDKASRQDAEDLLKAMCVYWGTSVTKLSRVLLEQRRYAKDKKLPEPKDIKTLNIFLNDSLKELDLRSNTPDTFRKTAEVTQAKLVVYNRRRTGEIQAIRLADYNKRCVRSCPDIMGQLSTFEQKLLETQEVMTVRGKTGRGVPVILPEDTKAAMEYLTNTEIRKSAGIDPKNPYVFASQGGGVVRAYDSLSKACRESNLEAPERVTSTNLRKYMATITQVLDLKDSEMKWVINHLGHTLDVHNIHYRATSEAIETTQIAKILLLQDSNKVGQFCGKTLQEIQLDDLVLDSHQMTADEEQENGLSEVIENVQFLPEDTDMDDEALEISSHIDEDKVPQKKRCVQSRNAQGKWTHEEEEEIRKLFRKNFENKARPTPKECAKMISKSQEMGGVIYKRKKDVLKKKLFRMIDKHSKM